MQIIIDGSSVQTQCEFHSQIAKTLDFPSYYGKNLDALWDCLGDFTTTIHGEAVEVVIKESEHLKKVVGEEYFTKIVDIFEEAREKFKKPLHLILE